MLNCHKKLPAGEMLAYIG